MWSLSTLYNPAIALFCLAFMSVEFVESEEVPTSPGSLMSSQDTLLNHLGRRSLGNLFDDWFDSTAFKSMIGYLVSADATIVLLGSTLTAFIGVTGLLTRLSQDSCLPVWFLKVQAGELPCDRRGNLQTNKWRGTHHRVILTFTVCALAVLAITQGEVA